LPFFSFIIIIIIITRPHHSVSYSKSSLLLMFCDLVCLLVTIVIRAKIVEANEMPFWGWYVGLVGTRNCV